LGTGATKGTRAEQPMPADSAGRRTRAWAGRLNFAEGWKIAQAICSTTERHAVCLQ
jgi:hypothetical protein